MAALKAALLLASLATLAAASPSTPRARVLALTEGVGTLHSRYSGLASALESWGFAVDERAVDDPSLRVRVWDDWLYDKLLVIPGGKGERRREGEGGGVEIAMSLCFNGAGGTTAPPRLPSTTPRPARVCSGVRRSLPRIAIQVLARAWSAASRRKQKTLLRRASRFPTPTHPTDFGGALSAAAVVAFVESGRDAFLALSPAASSDMRALAAAFGADPEPPAARVLAPTACANGDAATLLAPVTGPAPMVGASAAGGSVAYRGTGFTVAPAARAAWPSLAAPPAAASSAAPSSGQPAAAGAALALVVGAQTRANARFLVAGSDDLFSDAATVDVVPCGATAATPTANAAFAVASLAWAFNEAGSLVASPLRHSLADPAKARAHGNSNAATRVGDAPYRVSDPLTVAVDVAERVPGGGLRPYAPTDDVQVEYTMMDPHVRTFLNPVAATSNTTTPALTRATPDPRYATLAATFTAPDVYGIFKLAVHHARPGWSFLDDETVAPLRPFNHDEYGPLPALCVSLLHGRGVGVGGVLRGVRGGAVQPVEWERREVKKGGDKKGL